MGTQQKKTKSKLDRRNYKRNFKAVEQYNRNRDFVDQISDISEINLEL